MGEAGLGLGLVLGCPRETLGASSPAALVTPMLSSRGSGSRIPQGAVVPQIKAVVPRAMMLHRWVARRVSAGAPLPLTGPGPGLALIWVGMPQTTTTHPLVL